MTLPNPLRTVRGVLLALALFGSLLVVNALQTASLVVLPFSRRAFRRFNRECADKWWGAGRWVVERALGVRVVITGDEIPMRENAIVVVNHQDACDIPILFSLGWRKRMLGDMKWFAKHILKYAPGVGWGMLFLDCPFLKRDWSRDRRGIEATFRKFHEHGIPLWLINFPEGTRRKPEKLERSRRYAADNGLVPFDHHLYPRTKEFVATVRGLANHARAVYDVTIGYPDGPPSFMGLVRGDVHEVHLCVRRWEIAGLPADDGALAAWLVERFREKDRMLAEFGRTGKLAPAARPRVADGVAPEDRLPHTP